MTERDDATNPRRLPMRVGFESLRMLWVRHRQKAMHAQALRELSRLDDHRLDDIGLKRSDVVVAGRRPIMPLTPCGE